jgi:antitoxin component YwqK of YwqJK toxin-antitoxin module
MPRKAQKPKDFVKYHKDGSLWAKGKMLDGVQVGYWEWYRKDGSLMRTGSFSAGEQVGTWTTYHRDGHVVKETDFSPDGG